MKKVGAILAAVAMIVVAFVIRGGADDSDDGGGSDRVETLICPTEFRDVCEEIDGVDSRAQPAGDTADGLISAERSGDALSGEAWVVPEAWADVVIATRAFDAQRNPEIDPEQYVASDPIASTRAAVAIFKDAQGQLSCEISWTCLADHADRFPVGSPPANSATGLPIAAVQLVELLDGADFGPNQIRFPPFTYEAGPYDAMRSLGPGRFIAAATTVAESTGRTTSTFGTITITSQPSEPRIDLVIVTRDGTSLPGETRDAVAEAFLAANWDPPGTGDDGMPSGDILNVIREKDS